MNEEKRITVKDIATLAGVSKGTVDRVLHNRGEVSEASREKVMKIARQIGYKPNVHASLLPRWRGAAPIQRCSPRRRSFSWRA